MLVVADSSPLSTLAEIGHMDVLPALFEEVVIPPQVAAELAHPRSPHAIRQVLASLPRWLKIRRALTILSIPDLDAGEVEAISLAIESHADLLLIDEKDGREHAERRGLLITGTVGILARAAQAGLLDLGQAFDQLRQTSFFISEDVLRSILQQYGSGTPPT